MAGVRWNEDFDFFFPAGAAVPSMELEMWDRDTAARDDFMGPKPKSCTLNI